ncbi:MAG: CpaF family protein [Actinobacteria bacterium]|nr:CpaF family protein [Actinomycetota bacterium]
MSGSRGGLMTQALNEVIEHVRARVAQDVNSDVRYVAEDVVAAYSHLRLTPDDVIEVTNFVNGFGPIQPLLDDPSVEEIWINEPNQIFIARNGKSQVINVALSSDQIRVIIERMLSTSGRRVDTSQPFVDATLPDGSRLHVVIPDITRSHWAVNIRKFVMGNKGLDELIDNSTITPAAAQFLTMCVSEGFNIVVSGATQAGKTTLMNALLNCADPMERIVTCEEVFELQLTSSDWIALQTRQPSLEGSGEIPLRKLIKEALRMRPSRLVIGEVRQEECLDLLIAMNAGMPSMCSLHANGAREALAKLCLLPMLAGSNVTSDFVVPTVASVVDVVVQIEMQPSGNRRVSQISTVSGRYEASMIEMHNVFALRDGLLESTGLSPEIPQRLRARMGSDASWV